MPPPTQKKVVPTSFEFNFLFVSVRNIFLAKMGGGVPPAPPNATWDKKREIEHRNADML